MHCSNDIRFSGLAHRVLLVICQNHHVFPRITKIPIQICRHIFHVIDTTAQLTALAKVVDADQQRFAATRAGGVLEIVSLRSAVAEALGSLRRRRGGVVVPLEI